MDTRRKIVTPSQALEIAQTLHASGTPVVLISGYFDVLHPNLIRQLQFEVGTAHPARVFALILNPPNPLLTTQARTELAAALQMIDYVIDSTAQPPDFIAALAPDRHIRAQENHLATRERLIEHVLERHGRKSH